MFEVIQHRDGRQMSIHSQRDLDYMIAKGWRRAPIAAPVAEPPPAPVATPQKRKPGRPPKGK